MLSCYRWYLHYNKHITDYSTGIPIHDHKVWPYKSHPTDKELLAYTWSRMSFSVTTNHKSLYCFNFRSSYFYCTCCFAGREYTITFLRFCKQVSYRNQHVMSVLTSTHSMTPLYSYLPAVIVWQRRPTRLLVLITNLLTWPSVRWFEFETSDSATH